MAPQAPPVVRGPSTSGQLCRSRISTKVRANVENGSQSRSVLGGTFMNFRSELRLKTLLPVAISALALTIGSARAEDTVKIGLIVPLTGGQASTGKQIDNA